MFHQHEFTDAEWELLVELLEREQSELPPEIHHSRSSQTREELRHRLDMVRDLLQRMHVTIDM